MEKTFTEKVRCRIVFEFDYSCCNMYEEELHKEADDLHDIVLTYLADNITDIKPKVTLSNLRAVEE
jgi:hypothetical protein